MLGDALTRLAAAASGLSSALSAADASASTAALAETAVELARRVFGHLERRCVLAAGAGDFSLALAGAFLGAGVERFQVLGDGDCEEAARVLGAPWPIPSCSRRCSSMPISSWRKALWKAPRSIGAS